MEFRSNDLQACRSFGKIDNDSQFCKHRLGMDFIVVFYLFFECAQAFQRMHGHDFPQSWNCIGHVLVKMCMNPEGFICYSLCCMKKTSGLHLRDFR